MKGDMILVRNALHKSIGIRPLGPREEYTKGLILLQLHYMYNHVSAMGLLFSFHTIYSRNLLILSWRYQFDSVPNQS